jgi:hypothetical protein
VTYPGRETLAAMHEPYRCCSFNYPATTPPSEEATGLDVRAVVQAIANVAKRHGVTKDPSPVPLSLMHIYGYTAATPDMDAEIATEYARLASTERTEP